METHPIASPLQDRAKDESLTVCPFVDRHFSANTMWSGYGPKGLEIKDVKDLLAIVRHSKSQVSLAARPRLLVNGSVPFFQLRFFGLC